MKLLKSIVLLPLLFLSAHSFLTPAMTPEQIVTAQLAALQKDDMRAVYEFASPANKARVGSLDTFSLMVHDGPYRNLVKHEKADILLTMTTAPTSWTGLVRVIPSRESRKDLVEFYWLLSRCKNGPYPGCYMVDAVIPNM
jgi:hypothetical protein